MIADTRDSHVKPSSSSKPKHLYVLTLSIFFPDIEVSGSSGILVNFCREAINMHFVLIALRLSLFTLSQFCRVFRSLFKTEIILSGSLSAYVKLVSSANKRPSDTD